VLKHWACAKISKTRPGGGLGSAGGTSEDDEQVAKVIVEKFETMGAGAGSAGVSYAEIAKRAWEEGRTGLATRVGGFVHCGNRADVNGAATGS